MANQVVRPETRREFMSKLVDPYDPKYGPITEIFSEPTKLGQPENNRANEISLKSDNVKEFKVGIQDFDQAIMYYFKEVIKPSVIQNNTKVNVPVLYGDPENWKSVQADGYYRDANGRLLAPLIMFKRKGMTQNRGLGSKIDGNVTKNMQLFEKSFSKRSMYNNFSVLNNRVPETEYIASITPDYVTVEYDCVVWTYFIEQMDALVESINFASRTYWGDPSKFQFYSSIESFDESITYEIGQDRAIKNTFSITLNGYIIPESVNKSMASANKVFGLSQVVFGLETGDSQKSTDAVKKRSNSFKPLGAILAQDGVNVIINGGGTASYVLNAISASFASTASSADNFTVRGTLTAQTIVVQTITSSTDFVTGSTRFGSLSSNTHQFTGSVSITGSLDVNGSSVILSNQTSSMSVATASYVLNAVSASFASTSSLSTSASFASTASYILNAVSSSFASTASYWSGSILNATSASFASTASYVLNAVSASYAATASYVPASGVIGLNLSQISTGSVTASVNTGTNIFNIVSGSNTLVVVNNTGNVGIGTTSPAYKLDINGSARATGNLYFGPAGNYLFGDTNFTRIYDRNNQMIFQGFQSGVGDGRVSLISSNNSLYTGESNGGFSMNDANVGSNQTETFIIKRGYFANIAATTKNIFKVQTQYYSNITNGTILRGVFVDIDDTTTYTGFSDVRAFESLKGGGYFNTTNVATSAILQADSTTKGFLLPRMTAAQRTAISTPAQGLLVYDTGSVTEGLWLYNSGSTPGWQEVLTNTGSQSILGGLTATSFTGSLQGTSSWAQNAVTSSYILNAVSSSFASTASSADNFTVRGTLTAQTIVAQTITSSTDFVTGSTRFGSLLANTHQFTGSVSITGSTTITGGNFTLGGTSLLNWNGSEGLYIDRTQIYRDYYGNVFGRIQFSGNTSAYNIVTVGLVLSAFNNNTNAIHILRNPASNANNIYIGSNTAANASLSASFHVDTPGQGILIPRMGTAQYSNMPAPPQGLFLYDTGSAIEGFYYYSSGSVKSWTRLLNDTGSQTISGSLSVTQGITGSLFGTSSWANNVTSASFASTSSLPLRGLITASVAGATITFTKGDSTTFDLTVAQSGTVSTASYVTSSGVFGPNGSNSILSSSFASTASYVLNAVSSSHAATASSVNVLNQNVQISGSLSISGSIGSTIFSSNVDTLILTGSALISGSVIITGSLNVSGSITGSLLGTASFATTASYILNAVSSSFASTASLPLRGLITASVAGSTITFTKGDSTTFDLTIAQSGTVSTASYVTSSGVYGPFGANSILSASYATTASYVLNAVSASFASTASSADNFTVRGTLTAQTIVAQTITSSTDFVTGSTRFGSLSSNTHQFTGSVSVTGSLSVNNSSVVTGIGTSGQVAYWNGTTSQTGSIKLTYDGSKLTVGTSGNAIPGATTIARFVNNTDGSDVEINGNGYARLYFNDYSRGSDLNYYEMLNYETNFKISRLNDGNTIRSERLTIFGATGNIFVGSSPVDGGFKFDVSGSTRLNGNTQITGSLSVTQGITGSLFGTSSWAQNAVTASYIQASGVVGLNLSKISSGSVSASVNTDISASFRITSGSNTLFNVTKDGSVWIGNGSFTNQEYSLFVQGSGLISDFKIGSNGNANESNAHHITKNVATTIALTNISSGGGSALWVGTNASPISRVIVVGTGDIWMLPGTGVIVGGTTYAGFKHDVQGTGRYTNNLTVTGSVTATTGFTGSLFGTSSWAQNAVTASYILNAVSSSFATTASYASNGGVTQIVAGTNVTISPTSGTGSVTINAAAGAAFPFTGSALITGSLTVTGSISTTSTLNVGTSQFNNTSSVTTAGTTIVSSIATGSFTSAFYNYTIASASNARSGQVMSVWNGATVRYTEVTTTDIGNTATASFAVALSGANIQLNFTAPGSWTVKNIANLL